jgi:hypothetical protein
LGRISNSFALHWFFDQSGADRDVVALVPSIHFRTTLESSCHQRMQFSVSPEQHIGSALSAH